MVPRRPVEENTTNAQDASNLNIMRGLHQLSSVMCMQEFKIFGVEILDFLKFIHLC
jgi:hypothetical protein